MLCIAKQIVGFCLPESLRLPQAPYARAVAAQRSLFRQLAVADHLGCKSPRSVPLEGTSLPDAKADYDRLRVERVDDRLRPLFESFFRFDRVLKAHYFCCKARG
jgi:hypothetical protein